MPMCFFLEFFPYIEQLFHEDVLIGDGWTMNEGLRPLAYSTLADFVHHVRSQLSLPNLALVVHLFSKNVHDESLIISIQRMSCKVSGLETFSLNKVLCQTRLIEITLYDICIAKFFASLHQFFLSHDIFFK